MKNITELRSLLFAQIWQNTLIVNNYYFFILDLYVALNR